MLSLKQLSRKYATSISLVAAVLSLTLTSVPFRKSSETIERTSVRVFNIGLNEGLQETKLRVLDADAHTNRTVWETISSAEIQAGLERVEPGAWIPPHSHVTEEILLVYAGRGEVFDENGHVMELSPGSMVHIHRGVRHAFRNIGDEPLWLMWSFPRKSSKETFGFKQSYGKDAPA